MRVLLDEQIPRHLARELRGHDVSTVQQKGWAGLKNGELLRMAADAGFDVFVTADRNLEFQQNLSQTRVGSHPARCSKQRPRGSASACTWPAGRNSQEPVRKNTTHRGLTPKNSIDCHWYFGGGGFYERSQFATSKKVAAVGGMLRLSS